MTLSHLLSAVGNTLLATTLCIAIAVPLGTAAAILLFRSDVAGRRWAALAVASQLAIPLYVFAGGWSAGVGLQGWMRVAEWLGPTGVGWMQGWLGSLLAVALLHALACIPWCCLFVAMGLFHSDRAEEEAALLEGGWRNVIRHVWLPRLRPWIVAASIWCALGLMTEMVVSNLYMFSTVAELVYLDFSRQLSSPMTYLAAGLLCFLPIWVAGMMIVGRLPSLELVLSKPQYYGAVPLSLGGKRWIVSAVLWSVLAITVGLPMLNLWVKAGWTPQPIVDGSVGYRWGLERFAQTAAESVTLFQSEYYWSTVLSLASTAVALIVGVALYRCTAVVGVHRPIDINQPAAWRQRRVAAHGLMLLLIAVPGPLVGVLVAQCLNRPTPEWLGRLYSTTLAAPVIAQQFRLLPVCWLLICAIMASIPRRSWEMASQDGLSAISTLRIVVWPLTWPKWIALVLLLMLLSIGELSCSMSVLPPGVTTTSMRLFEILHFGMRHQDSAICGILVLLGWLAAAVILWAVRKSA